MTERMLTSTGPVGATDPKTPTVIRYSTTDSTQYEWGNLVRAATDPSMGSTIVGIKLLLNPGTQDKDKPSHWPTGITDKILDEANLPKSAVQVAADYIRAIFSHAEREMTQNVPASYLETCKKEYVMSVPAAWSDKAKDATERVRVCHLNTAAPTNLRARQRRQPVYQV